MSKAIVIHELYPTSHRIVVQRGKHVREGRQVDIYDIARFGRNLIAVSDANGALPAGVYRVTKVRAKTVARPM